MINIGLHVSIAGGVQNAPLNAAEKECLTFQYFTRSPRGGLAPVITEDIAKEFLDNCQKNKIKSYYIHTPYYINFASIKPRIRNGSVQVIRQELERGSKLKTTALMTHLGSTKDYGRKKSVDLVVDGLAKALEGYKGETQFLLENSAGAGGTGIGDKFEELGYIIKKLKKYKVGVCLDTCHAFASGYDMRDKKAVNETLKDFDKHVGLSNLVLIHANDSKTELGSNKDRHEHIGNGNIGKEGFKYLIRHPALKNVDIILETPHDGKESRDLRILNNFNK